MCETIKSLAEYIDYINRLSKEFVLSRGQEKDLALLPSVYRIDDNGMRYYSNQAAKEFIEEFKNNSVMYIDNYIVNMKSEFDWTILAQHFGVPTCLLDFTYSHLVSLMFAVENAFRYHEGEEGNSVVWFLNPKGLNLKAINRNEIINLSDNPKVLDSLENAQYPCVVTAVKNNNRIVAQNGLFVFFPKHSRALNEIEGVEEVLKKVIIPHECAKRILASLYTMGMRFKDLYPELTSVSKDILLKHDVLEYYKMEADNE